jgi:hypothetical protein
MSGIIIESGNGNGQSAAVSKSGNRLDVSSRSNSRIYYNSRDLERSFSIYSEDDDAAAGDFVFYFKNTDTLRRFYVEEIIVSAELASTVKLHVVTGTASGTDITPNNLNLGSGNVAAATAKGNAAVTGLTSSAVLEAARCSANQTVQLSLKDALIIGLNDAIAVEYDTGSNGDIEITVVGYFDVE